MANEKNTDVMGTIKGYFNKSGDKNKVKETKSFSLRRQDAMITMVIAICALIGAVVYGNIVNKEYNAMNKQTDALKEFDTYNISPKKSLLDEYVSENDNISKVDGMVNINKVVTKDLDDAEAFKDQQQGYYETLLQNIYLPSLNVWKNPYTENFDMTVLGQKYLENDKFDDLYLIQYRSEFIKYVGNDATYNTIENINIGDIEEIEGTDYFFRPITVSFTSPNKHSFLLMVNKLSTTSNITNVSLLNEFFFYLITNIKEHKSEEIKQLMIEYWDEFKESSGWDGFGDATNIDELTESQFDYYQDKVIGYNIYKGLTYDGTGSMENLLIDDEIIDESIREDMSCEGSTDDVKCYYSFREKYRDLPYLAYGIGLNGQEDRTTGFLDFLKDLASIVAITSFDFEKSSSSSFFTTSEDEYRGSVTFNAYGRTISQGELDEASQSLGALCFGKDSTKTLTPEEAVIQVQDSLSNLSVNEDASNVTDLEELEGLFLEIQGEYEGMTNYNKMIKLFELWRMLNDANLCQ